MSLFSAADRRHMARALHLAERGLFTTDPNPRVGCVLARDGAVVGEGWHERAGGPHAERRALDAAAQRARGATAYVTLEPCCVQGRTPPCHQALIDAGVVRVVAALEDPNPLVAGGGLRRLRAAGVDAACGLMADEAAALNPGFVMRMGRGRPFVRVKSALSLDGRSAPARGGSRWITGPAARADVQRLRARSSAILTGIGTVRADDPALDVRDLEIGRQPLRVVLDPALELAPTARLLTRPGATLVLAAAEEAEKRAALRAAGATVVRLPGDRDALDLHAVMAELAAREVNELHVEAGATLAGALIVAGLVDELILYVAPTLLGDRARALFALPLERLEERIDLTIRELRPIGPDWRITATRAAAPSGSPAAPRSAPPHAGGDAEA